MDKDYTFPEKNGKRIVSELLPTEENHKGLRDVRIDGKDYYIPDEVIEEIE